MTESLKSDPVSETCRKHVIGPDLFYRWKDEMEKGALLRLEEATPGGGGQEVHVLFAGGSSGSQASYCHYATYGRERSVPKFLDNAKVSNIESHKSANRE